MKKIGAKIMQIRENLNISREDLSTRSGEPIEKIIKIENNEIIPSLTPLIKIARALGVRLGTFMDDHESLGPVVYKNTQNKEAIDFSNNSITEKTAMRYLPLAAEKAGRHMEPFTIEVEPLTAKYDLSTHEGEEFIYVLSGEIEIIYGKEKFLLKSGESIYYDSIISHHVHSSNNEISKILAVIYVPV
jgi:transcriptional regulator with XRE-family HTH domain